MTRLLCTSDTHLGAGGGMLPPGVRLRDQEDVLRRVVEIAREHKVDAAIVAGDLFHRPRPVPAELLAAQRFLNGLSDATQGNVCVILGNCGHDQEGDGRESAVEIFASPGVGVHRTPELALGGMVATLPSVPIGRLLAAHPGMGRDEAYALAAELLVMEAARLRAAGARVLVAHWSVSGAVTATGMSVGPDFGVVLPLAELEALGFDAIVLGHIHAVQWAHGGRWHDVGVGGLIGETSALYCSSPLPLDFGEADGLHGVWILDDTHGWHAEFVEIESRRLVTIDFDCTDEAQARWLAAAAQHPTMIDPARVADAIVRLRYTASEEQHRRIDQNAVRRALLDAGAATVRIEPTILRGTRQRNAVVDTTLSPLDAITEWATAQQLNGKAEPLRHLTRTYLEGATA